MLVFAGMILVVTAAVFALSALGANSSALFLGVIVPTLVGSDLCSRVVMYYGPSGQRKR
jgi:hypothetical protein